MARRTGAWDTCHNVTPRASGAPFLDAAREVFTWQSSAAGRRAGVIEREGPGRGGGSPASTAGTRSPFVDYKDVGTLRKFISDRGKIRSRRITGACRRHQNQIATAVKRARELALLPYVAESRDSRDDRGRDRDRDRDRDR